MIEAQLSKTTSQKRIVTLYANVIEHFSAVEQSGGKSMHVGHIKSIEITTDKKGKHTLTITSPHISFLNDQVDDAQLDKVKEWIVEVQRAMKSTSL